MPQIKQDWAEALLLGIREWFQVGYAKRPIMFPELFSMQTSNSDSEFYHSFGAVSPDAWADFKNTGRVASVGFDKGYKTTFTHEEYVVELPIRRTLIEDNKYPQIIDATQQLGDSAALKREHDAASVFNNCSAAAYAGGDGVPLTDAAHPASPTKAATTQANEATSALSATALAAARLAMMAFTDDVNELAGVIPDLLLVGPSLEDSAKILCQTPTKTSSADADINPRYGLQYKVWPYLTSASQWFLIDSIKMKQSLIWFDRSPVSIVPKVEDKTLWATYISEMRYSYGWRDWRWIYRGNA